MVVPNPNYHQASDLRMTRLAALVKGYNFNFTLRALLDTLGNDELVFIGCQPDLLAESNRISILPFKELEAEVESKLGIKTKTRLISAEDGDYGYTEYYLETLPQAAALPEWAKAQNFNVGFWISSQNHYIVAARKLLFRRVRMNLWLRIIAAKSVERTRKLRAAAQEAQDIEDFIMGVG